MPNKSTRDLRNAEATARQPTDAQRRVLEAMRDRERPHEWTRARALGYATKRTWDALVRTGWVRQNGALLRGEPCYSLSPAGLEAVRERPGPGDG